MTKPSDITQEQLDQWNKYYLKYCDESNTKVDKESFYAGFYIEHHLQTLNCPADLCERICFAAGQRFSAINDPWSLAVKIIEDYKKGIWEEPGLELARKIMLEQFGPNPNPIAILDWLKSQGININKLMESRGHKVPEDIRN
jgi:hypothetical protein